MDNKGGSSAAISGGSGENTGFLNAPEGPMGEIEDVESKFENDPTPSEMANEFDEKPEGDMLNPVAQEAPVEEAKPTPKAEDDSEKEQIIREYDDILEKYAKHNESDINDKLVKITNRSLDRCKDDPSMMASVFSEESRKYRIKVFPQTWGEDGKGGMTA